MSNVVPIRRYAQETFEQWVERNEDRIWLALRGHKDKSFNSLAEELWEQQ